MIGYGNEIHILAVGKAHNIVINIFKRTRSIGILCCMRVELTEIEAIGGFADGETPAVGHAVVVLTVDDHGCVILAVGKLAFVIECRLLAFNGGGSLYAFNGDDNIGVLACIGKGSGDLRGLILMSCAIGSRSNFDNLRIINNADNSGLR